ncbi:MAG: phage portal protein [Mycobacterium sp.]|nr:phage portal protein [Mycobacterium sp.]
MGLFSGRRAVDDTPQRSMTLPFDLSALTPGVSITDYATVDANGENALRDIAIGSAIDLICSLTSEMPVDVYRGYGSDRQRVNMPANLKDPGADGHGLQDWLYTLLQSWLYRGNAYGHIVSMSAAGDARQVALLHPDQVVATSDGDGRVAWMVNGQRLDERAERMFIHRRVNPVPGRVLGASVIERHAMQIGTSLAAAKFGAQWFADGAHPSGLLVNQSDITKEQADTVKARWLSLFRGTREPAVLGKGWDWKPLQVNPAESQFLETQRFSEAQCARIFGPAVAETLGYETGGSMTYANVVDRRSDLLTFSLNKWLTRAERLLTELLPEPQYVRFNRDSLLQSTTLARFEAHGKALEDRWRTVNEIRDIEDLPPVAWGDLPNEKPTTGSPNP